MITKEEIKKLFLNASIMDEDDKIKNVEDIGYNCLEITINNTVYQMGFESDFEEKYIEETEPSIIGYCRPSFLSNVFGLPQDMFSREVLEPNFGDSDFILEICEATNTDYKDILKEIIDIDGVVCCYNSYTDEYDELENGMIVFRVE